MNRERRRKSPIDRPGEQSIAELASPVSELHRRAVEE
jgi:hypothetical protein